MARTGRDPAAPTPSQILPDDQAREALDLMTRALELIDATDGAGVAGAHLDLAVHRLREWIDGRPPR